MKLPAKAVKTVDAEQQLKGFIDKFNEHNQKLIHSIRKALRKRFPRAFELVYDNYNFFVIAYGPTERPSECIVSMAAAANGVNLFFLYGAKLPDPKKILLGSGNQVRFIRLETASVLQRPEVEALISAALDLSKVPFPATGKSKLIIRSVSAKQRPRRK